MDESIPLCVPSLKGNEWKYVQQCLDTEWVSSAGPFVDSFEKELAAYTRVRYGVACSSGTAALHVALSVAGVQKGDEVIVPTLTFIATVNAVNYVGAEPVFMDCDEFYNIDAEKTIEFLKEQTTVKSGVTFNRQTHKRIAAIVPVHVYGNAALLQDLNEICQKMNIRVVEDATESLGTVYTQGRLKDRHAGSVGDLGCLSFNGNKMITTGAGGMVLTDNPRYAEQAKYLTTQAKDDEVMWVHNAVGFNYRLSNLQAALGMAQMEQLPRHLEIKQRNYHRYKDELKGIPGLRLGEVPEYARNNYWMYPLQIDQAVYGRARDEVMRHLAAQRIQSRPVWYLNHFQQPYAHCQRYKIERAEQLWQQTLNLPCSVGLKEEHIERVIECLKYG